MYYQTNCNKILNLFYLAGKGVPSEDSNMGRAVQILQTICDSQSHTIPEPDTVNGMGYNEEDLQAENESIAYDIFEALEELETMIENSEDDYNFEFDGNEYRLIKSDEDVIWPIYRDEIQSTVEDCYSDVINLDKVPSFIAVSVDWEQTARNAYADGYGHQFSHYDGSEEESASYYIFRTN